MDDHDLILGCLEGHKTAWDAFVDRFAKLIHWSIRQTLENSSYKSRPGLCEDVFQDFFRRLLERQELLKVKDSGHLRKFLCVSASNLTLDRLKSLTRYEKSSELESLGLEVESLGPDAAKKEALSLVQEVVEDLSDAERLCLELHYYEGKSYRQIGEDLGMALETVSSVIRRTREKLKNRLMDKGFEL